MGDLDEAGKTLAALGRLLVLAPQLEKIPSLEKHLKSLEDSVEQAIDQERKAREKLNATLRLGEIADAEHKQKLALLGAELDKLRSDVEANIAASQRAAAENASAIIAKARETAASIHAEAEQSAVTAAHDRDKARNEKSALEKEIAEKTKLKDKISATIAGWAA